MWKIVFVIYAVLTVAGDFQMLTEGVAPSAAELVGVIVIDPIVMLSLFSVAFGMPRIRSGVWAAIFLVYSAWTIHMVMSACKSAQSSENVLWVTVLVILTIVGMSIPVVASLMQNYRRDRSRLA